jgi:glucose-6-phosphate isomerase
LEKDRVLARILARDHTVWDELPDDISDRLDWLDGHQRMGDQIPELTAFAGRIRKAGFQRVLLLGMGAAGLPGELFNKIFGTAPGALDLTLLDTTDPDAIAACARRHRPQETLYLVADAAGRTLETLSLMGYFFNAAAHALGREAAGEHFCAISNPGSRLESTALELEFGKIFLNTQKIDGAYGVLSLYGLVPAALLGVDITRLLARAAAVEMKPAAAAARESLDLGATMGALWRQGCDKLTLILDPRLAGLGPWIEQLVAQSTGKLGRGILPVIEPLPENPRMFGEDRWLVHVGLNQGTVPEPALEALAAAGNPLVRITLDDPYDLGGVFLKWELAAAIAGHLLSVNPFVQPDAQRSEIKTQEVLGVYRKTGQLPRPTPAYQDAQVAMLSDSAIAKPDAVWAEFLQPANEAPDAPRPYIAIQAYVSPSAAMDEALEALRRKIAQRCRHAVTLEYGPRCLHTTGQLHKGDAGRGRFVQIIGPTHHDLAIPDSAGQVGGKLTFGILKQAQALGDREALRGTGRRVISFLFAKDVISGLEKLADRIQA